MMRDKFLVSKGLLVFWIIGTFKCNVGVNI